VYEIDARRVVMVAITGGGVALDGEVLFDLGLALFGFRPEEAFLGTATAEKASIAWVLLSLL
jgi:hypothetical protein